MPDPRIDRPDWQHLIEEAVTREGKIGAFYSYFHEYSFLNTMLLRMQGMNEPAGPHSAWQKVGRHIIAGSKAKLRKVRLTGSELALAGAISGAARLSNLLQICSKAKEVLHPVMIQVEVEDGQKEERVIGFKYKHSVFALSQTEGQDLTPIPTPGWDLQAALEKLGIREIPFSVADGNMQGFSIGVEFAINPVAVNRNKTVFHELGHIVLGHTVKHHYEEYQTHRGIMEFQAESTALLCLREVDLLDDDTASEVSGYIHHWLKHETPPDRAIQQVFTATDRILRVGVFLSLRRKLYANPYANPHV